MRADLVKLAVRLGWVAPDEKEELALASVMERLRHDGEGVLLIYDNAIDSDALKSLLPRGGGAKVLITSNAHAWRGVAEPIDIRLWPKEIGADYLIARTGRYAERAPAEILSELLGGLPLAHEQAAAYCERLDISFDEFRRRFEAAPAHLLDDTRHAPAEYHDGLTVTKTFALAIEEATKLHPGAEPLIVHAALLAPEPIPLFLFAEAHEELGMPLASALASDGLEEAVAALRTFALLKREMISDERESEIRTDTIRLHRLVREIAAVRCEGEARDRIRRALATVLAAIFPDDGYRNPLSWPRCALLTSHVLATCNTDIQLPRAANSKHADLLDRAAMFFHGRGDFAGARPLHERALAIREGVLGPEHPDTARSLVTLALLLRDQGELIGARPLVERALSIYEKVLGPEHPDTAWSLSTLAVLLRDQGDYARAQCLHERALLIRERVLGPEHPDIAWSLNAVALLLRDGGNYTAARPLFERALAIREKALGPQHRHTAWTLNSLAVLLREQGDYAGARRLHERALAIREKALGPEHPETAWSLNHIALLLRDQGDYTGARPLFERALAIREKVLGPERTETAWSLSTLALLLRDQGDHTGARPLLERALAIYERLLGPEHPHTAWSLSNLSLLLREQGDLSAAPTLAERAVAARKRTLPDTPVGNSNTQPRLPKRKRSISPR
jgi:tetratricopeptide (TPR) repeat protein